MLVEKAQGFPALFLVNERKKMQREREYGFTQWQRSFRDFYIG